MVLKAAPHGSILLLLCHQSQLSDECFSRKHNYFLQWSSMSCGSRSLPHFSFKGSNFNVYGRFISETHLWVSSSLRIILCLFYFTSLLIRSHLVLLNSVCGEFMMRRTWLLTVRFHKTGIWRAQFMLFAVVGIHLFSSWILIYINVLLLHVSSNWQMTAVINLVCSYWNQ